jgi:outer membrane lipoprotein SlyB
VVVMAALGGLHGVFVGRGTGVIVMATSGSMRVTFVGRDAGLLVSPVPTEAQDLVIWEYNDGVMPVAARGTFDDISFSDSRS